MESLLLPDFFATCHKGFFLLPLGHPRSLGQSPLWAPRPPKGSTTT